ncbi:MAG TPA: alpha/beta fold hydrolase [Dehalococcoidia bacterium]
MNQEIRFVTSADGTQIACGLIGRGRPLVKAPTWLSHVGMDIESPVWRHWWTELSNSRYFLRFDQRGCGLSDRDVADISFDRWVEDLEAVVDSLRVDSFDLLGMSQGGAVAMAYAARHPERVRHLVLLGAFALGWAHRSGPEEHQSTIELIRRGWGSNNPAYRQMFTSQFMPDATMEQMLSFNELQRLSTSPEMAVKFQVAVGEIDVRNLLARIQAPTVVFHCREDARIPFDQGRFIAASIPGATFVPLPGSSHILLPANPAWEVFREHLREFVGPQAAAEALGVAPQAPAELPERLTPRELEVLRLVSEGKTDRQVAEELYISIRTVGNHVKNILEKTGSANRTAAAIFASTHGLLMEPQSE